MFGISLIALAVNFICVEDAAFRFLGLNHLFCLSWDYRHSCLQKQLTEARGEQEKAMGHVSQKKTGMVTGGKGTGQPSGKRVGVEVKNNGQDNYVETKCVSTF